MNLKLVLIDLDNPGNFLLRDMPEGLLSGTEGQTLYFDGTDWVVTSQIEIQNGGTEVRIKSDQYAIYGGVSVGDHQKIVEAVYRTSPYSFIRYFAIGMQFEKNLTSGEILHYIKSNTDLTGKYLKVSDNTGLIDFVDIHTPNTIKNVATDLDFAVGSGWVDVVPLEFNLEPDVTYELNIMCSIFGASGRNCRLRINTAAATYTFRPFVVNTGGAGTDILYAKDASILIPQNMDNEAALNLTTGNFYHHVELRGIIKTTNNIPVAKLQFYNDSGFNMTIKAFSYLKLSR